MDHTIYMCVPESSILDYHLLGFRLTSAFKTHVQMSYIPLVRAHVVTQLRYIWYPIVWVDMHWSQQENLPKDECQCPSQYHIPSINGLSPFTFFQNVAVTIFITSSMYVSRLSDRWQCRIMERPGGTESGLVSEVYAPRTHGDMLPTMCGCDTQLQVLASMVSVLYLILPKHTSTSGSIWIHNAAPRSTKRK